MGRVLLGVVICAVSIVAVIFRRPIARFSVRMQNATWGFHFGERTVRLTERWIWVVAAGAIAVAAIILFAPHTGT
jgi:hypothetical protein